MSKREWQQRLYIFSPDYILPLFGLNCRSFIKFSSPLPSVIIKLPLLNERLCVRAIEWKLALMAANWVHCWLRAPESAEVVVHSASVQSQTSWMLIGREREKDIVINNESSLWLIESRRMLPSLRNVLFAFTALFTANGKLGGRQTANSNCRFSLSRFSYSASNQFDICFSCFLVYSYPPLLGWLLTFDRSAVMKTAEFDIALTVRYILLGHFV